MPSHKSFKQNFVTYKEEVVDSIIKDMGQQ